MEDAIMRAEPYVDRLCGWDHDPQPEEGTGWEVFSSARISSETNSQDPHW